MINENPIIVCHRHALEMVVLTLDTYVMVGPMICSWFVDRVVEYSLVLQSVMYPPQVHNHNHILTVITKISSKRQTIM